MHHPLTDIVPIADLDTDGAIRETADTIEINGDTRASFFKKAGMAGGGLLAGSSLMGALPSLAGAVTLSKNDRDILNFALTLEYLEAAFYREAVAKGNLSGSTKAFAKLVLAHETTHVKALKGVLGSRAVKSPSFNFKGTNLTQGKFQQTSFALENEGVHAYLGQAGKIQSKKILGVAATIATIEARHAAGIAQIIGQTTGKKGITPNGAFDVPFTKCKVIDDVNALKFTKRISCP